MTYAITLLKKELTEKIKLAHWVHSLINDQMVGAAQRDHLRMQVVDLEREIADIEKAIGVLEKQSKS
jgi:hypothetical protein